MNCISGRKLILCYYVFAFLIPVNIVYFNPKPNLMLNLIKFCFLRVNKTDQSQHRVKQDISEHQQTKAGKSELPKQ